RPVSARAGHRYPVRGTGRRGASRAGRGGAVPPAAPRRGGRAGRGPSGTGRSAAADGSAGTGRGTSAEAGSGMGPTPVTGAQAHAARKELAATERRMDRLSTQMEALHERMAAHDQADYVGLQELTEELRGLEAEN